MTVSLTEPRSLVATVAAETPGGASFPPWVSTCQSWLSEKCKASGLDLTVIAQKPAATGRPDVDPALVRADCLLVAPSTAVGTCHQRDAFPSHVNDAIDRGTAVIVLDAEDGATQDSQIIWTGFAAADDEVTSDLSLITRPLEQGVDAFLTCFGGSEAPSSVQASFSNFLGEKVPSFLLRLEYQLLLLLTAGRRIRPWEFFPAKQAETQPNLKSPNSSKAFTSVDVRRQADTLANVYSQKFRSASVGRFVLSAIAAVGAALLALVVPEAQTIAFGLEFLATVVIILSFKAATQNDWHGKWLERRYIAEQLRFIESIPQASAMLLLGRRYRADHRYQWNDVVTDRIARTTLDEEGLWTEDSLTKLPGSLDALIDDQIGYNTQTVDLMSKMESRLGRVGLAFFMTSMSLALISLAITVFAPQMLDRLSAPLIAALAFFPALGAAIFGIRVQSNFKMEAVRARQVLDRLETLKSDRAKQDTTDVPLAMRHARRLYQILRNDMENWQQAQTARALDLP